LLRVANDIEVESPRVAYLFSCTLLHHRFLSCINDIEVESPRVTYLCKSRVVTTTALIFASLRLV
jgi:hypothetical protein